METLTHEELIKQLDYNPLTGIFKRKISAANGRVKKGDIAGSKDSRGYLKIMIEGQSYKAHRLAWFYYYGYMPENDLDHRDRIRHHNWILNLRQVTQQCNIRNTGNSKRNTSGVKGVYWYKASNKWRVEIMINGKTKFLGGYKDFDEAVCHRLAGEQCVNWSGCDSNSPAYKWVKENIQND